MIRKFLSRRDLIRIITYLGASATLLPSFAGNKNTADKTAKKTTRNKVSDLCDLISNKHSAVQIGNAYLSQHDSAKDPESIAGSIIIGGGRSYTTLDELRSDLSKQVRNDFRHGRTVLVGDWVLSQTEASVYALIAVTSAS